MNSGSAMSRLGVFYRESCVAYLAFSTKDPLPDEATVGQNRPIIRHVTLGAETKAVLCGGFSKSGPAAGSQQAIARYVSEIGGVTGDWEVLEILDAEYDSIEWAVYQPIRDAAAAATETRRQELRDLLTAQTVRVGDLASTDRVWLVPTTAPEAAEFLRAMALAMRETGDSVP